MIKFIPISQRSIFATTLLLFFIVILLLFFSRDNTQLNPKDELTSSVVNQIPIPIDAQEVELKLDTLQYSPKTITHKSDEQEITQDIAQLHDLTRRALKDNHQYQLYLQCVEENENSCLKELSDALYQVNDLNLIPAIAELDLLSSIENMPAQDLRNYFDDLLLESTSAADRVTLLQVLNRTPELSELILSDTLLQDLDTKPTIEVQLLLQRYGYAGTGTEESLYTIASVAANPDTDQRLQSAALLSLANHQASTILNQSVWALEQYHDEEWSGWIDSVAPALGICGLPCFDAASSLAVLSQPEFLVELFKVSPYEQRREYLEALKFQLPASTLANVQQQVDL